ncbi:uncharacterized protein [Malus domestica]|uniref:uncharacterized protein n=1 Tax=Malus domestica TaxID=3750 RepID=UPI003976F28A
MKKDIPFVWDEACHNAFESIKKYLSSPPVLGPPVPGKPLILYIAAQESSIGALLVQEIESQKEGALYYLSQTLTGVELNYSPIEKICLALYEIIYISAKAVNGQALADFHADHPIPADWKISDDLPVEEVFYIDIFPTWMMFFDGSARADGAGAGVRKDDLIPYFWLATQLLQDFETVTLEHVPRKENQMAYALANLASSMTLGEDEAADVPICQRWVIPLIIEMLLDDTNVISVLPVDVEEWRQPLIDYLEHGKLPDAP